MSAFHDYQKQYPQGTHFESAGRKVEDLRFQTARNSDDETVLQSFLKDYPSGDLHDQVYKHLDDVVLGENQEGRLGEFASLRFENVGWRTSQPGTQRD